MAAVDRFDADLETYLGRLAAERGYSPHTIGNYRRDLRRLRTLMPAADPAQPPAWEVIDEAAIRRWVAGASRGGLAPSSIARGLSAWRGFLDWLAIDGRIVRNPARTVRAPRAARRLPKALSPDQAASLLDHVSEETFEARRDQAIAELLYSSGLRLAELVGLDDGYFDEPGYRSQSWLAVGQREVRVRGKGSKTRVVPVGAQALAALAEWRQQRAALLARQADGDRHALFLSRRGTRLSVRSVQVRLKRLALVRGVPADVHPHVMRHSFASHLLQSSGDLRAVQELLGHANITTTQVYTSLDFQRLAAVYDAAHPRARRKPGAA